MRRRPGAQVHDATYSSDAAAGAAAVAAAFTASSSACEDEYKPEMRGGRDLCGELAMSGQCHKNLVHLSCARWRRERGGDGGARGGCSVSGEAESKNSRDSAFLHPIPMSPQPPAHT